MKQTLLFICCFIIASNIVETKKFFDPAIFQKCWRGVGEQPTFAKQIILQQVLPAAIALFETCQFAD